MGPPVAADGDAGRAFICCESRERPAKGVGVRFVKGFSDNSANVVFAQDGAIESVGH